MGFLYSITMCKCGVYNIPEKVQMITTCSTYIWKKLSFSSVQTLEILHNGPVCEVC